MLKLIRRPKSPYWIIRGTTPQGVRLEESTGVADQKIAQEIFVNRQAEILKEHVWGKKATVTFAHAVADYLEHGDGDPRFLTPLLDHFGVTLLRVIGQHEIDAAAKKLLPNAANATRNRQVYTPVSAVLRHAAHKGWCDTPILKRPKLPPNKIRWIKPDEAERLIEASAEHLRPLVVFLLYTGARTGEAVWLDWSAVDIDKAQVTFHDTKNGESRSVPLHPRLVKLLAPINHREGEVFRTPSGEPYTRPARIDDTSAGTRIASAFGGACKRAGIKDFTPHCCRHTWATWMMQSGKVTIADLKTLGGWKSVAMVMRYAHTNVETHAKSIENLPWGNDGGIDQTNIRKA